MVLVLIGCWSVRCYSIVFPIHPFRPYWATTSTSAIQLPPDVKARADTWSTPAGAVVKMMHPAGWGSWAFEVGSYADGVLTFSRGGNQEARGNRGTGKFFVENVIEELDAENEWFLDEKYIVLAWA